MSNAVLLHRCISRAVLLGIGLVAVVACDDGSEGGLGDEAASALVTDVLDGLDLPGDPRSLRSDVPTGELLFGLHCPIRAAGLDPATAVVAFPTPRSAIRERLEAPPEVVDVSLLVFDTAASATSVLEAYGDDASVDCLGEHFGGATSIDSIDPIETSGVTAAGYRISGPSSTEGTDTSTYEVVLGRTLLDVSVFAPDAARRRDLASGVIADVVAAMRAGGA